MLNYKIATIFTDNGMLKKEAKEITGGLSAPSKMPGPSFNLPAAACITGSKLVAVKGSTCSGCYALKGRYRFGNVQAALKRRLSKQGSASDQVEYFTVSIDPTEGDLARFTAGELGEALGIPVHSVRALNVGAHSKQGVGQAPVREYWREIMCCVLLLLVLESTLAAAFGRRRR